MAKMCSVGVTSKDWLEVLKTTPLYGKGNSVDAASAAWGKMKRVSGMIELLNS